MENHKQGLLKNVLPTVAGFTTIALLSSVFAKLLVHFFPQLNGIPGQAVISLSNIMWGIVKLLSILYSCVIGGVITTLLKGSKRIHLLVGGLTAVIIIWLWINIPSPLWFWLSLLLTVIPAVLLGRKIGLKLINSSIFKNRNNGRSKTNKKEKA